jgi:hypothetical protein
MTDPAPGWYADPGNATGLRWWDGQAWTDHLHSQASPTPPTPPPSWAPIGPTSALTSGPGVVTADPTRSAAISTVRRRRDPMNRRLLLGVAVVGLALLLGAAVGMAVIGSRQTSNGRTAEPTTPSSTVVTQPPTTQPTPDPALATDAHQYLAAAAILNQAQRTFVQGLNSATTQADLETLAVPFAQALDTFDQAVLSIAVPASMEDDRNDLVADNGTLRDAVASVSTLDPDQLTQWSSQIAQGLRSSGRAAGALRTDLGLPPAYNGQGVTI